MNKMHCLTPESIICLSDRYENSSDGKYGKWKTGGNIRKTFDFIFWLDKGDNSTYTDERIKCYTNAIESWNESDGNNIKADAYYNRGIIHTAKQEYDHAVDDFGEALTLGPKYAIDYFNRAFGMYQHK